MEKKRASLGNAGSQRKKGEPKEGRRGCKLESNGGRMEIEKDRRHDGCKDICMRYKCRAKQEGREPKKRKTGLQRLTD